MKNIGSSKKIRVVIAGLGNCASSLIEGIYYYRKDPDKNTGILFPNLCGYSVRDIEIVGAIDISDLKVGRTISEAIYQYPNNFVRIENVRIDSSAIVFRGPTLDGNPDHLAQFVKESSTDPVNIVSILKDLKADVFINFLPTGSVQATEFYCRQALEAECTFINCIPTILAQRPEIQKTFLQKQIPILGDDIKSQLGTTILHRSLLHMLESRGATLNKSSQVNIGGNTDFANFVYRAETKLISKCKSLARYMNSGAKSHIGHHYDTTKGSLKNAFIEIESSVFGGSPVKISVKLESDDKPNSAGSVVDLIRISKGAMNKGIGGYIPEACAFYFKSPPSEMDDLEALKKIKKTWAS